MLKKNEITVIIKKRKRKYFEITYKFYKKKGFIEKKRKQFK